MEGRPSARTNGGLVALAQLSDVEEIALIEQVGCRQEESLDCTASPGMAPEGSVAFHLQFPITDPQRTYRGHIFSRERQFPRGHEKPEGRRLQSGYIRGATVDAARIQATFELC